MEEFRWKKLAIAGLAVAICFLSILFLGKHGNDASVQIDLKKLI
jgi:hypothetical protein